MAASEVLSAHSGGVAMLYCAEEHFSVEALHLYGANVVRFQLASGGQRWYIAGRYLAPENATTIEVIVAAISQQPRGAALLVVGDFNTDLEAPEGQAWDEEIAVAMAAAGLEYLSDHFLPQHKPWLRDCSTWCMRRGGQEVRSRTDYILSTYHCLIQNVAVRDVRHNMEHDLVLGYLHGAAPTAHSRYIRKCTHFPTRTPTTLDGVDHLFAELQEAITKPPQQERLRQAWISPETWRFINARTVACRTGDQRNSRGISRTIKASLQEYQHQRVAKAGSSVESLLASDPLLIRDAWMHIRECYRDAIDRPPAPIQSVHLHHYGRAG